jgi:hypothetical protein
MINLCVLCNQSVNLTVDLHCDESGQAVHGECYFNRIVGNYATGDAPCPTPPSLGAE